jgi:hypothetical protein
MERGLEKKKCAYCGDGATELWRAVIPVCMECWNEKAHGIVSPKPVHFFGGGPALAGKGDS